MQLTRRRFLKQAVTAGTRVVGGSVLLGSCAFGPGKNLRNMADDEHIEGLDRFGRQILHYASLAPSGHNTQPWQIRVEAPDRWVIGTDPARRLPAVDPENREALLSIGAFLENLTLAAASQGIHVELEMMAKSNFDTELIRVHRVRHRPVDYPMQRLVERRTVKHGHQNRELRRADVAALTGSNSGSMFYFPRGTKHADCIRDAAVETFGIQSARDDAQRELVQWLRLRRDDIERCRDGLTPGGMEIQGLAGFFVRNFVSPEDFLKPMYRQQGADLTAKLAAEGAGWMIITSEGRSVEDLLDAGRRFQRMALRARELGIAIHPMTQALEEPVGQTQVTGNHDAGMIPQFILRVGYVSPYPDPVSPRRPVGWFVTS